MDLVDSDWHAGYGIALAVPSTRIRNVGAKFELDIQNPCSRGGVFLPSVVEMQILKPWKI